MSQTIEDIKDFIDVYCEEPAKTVAFSVLSLLVIATQPDIDYNELFSFIELPQEIESIDYNKLVGKLTSGDFYKNLIK